MKCEACASGVAAALKKVGAVVDVSVALKEGVATIKARPANSLARCGLSGRNIRTSRGRPGLFPFFCARAPLQVNSPTMYDALELLPKLVESVQKAGYKATPMLEG